MTFNKIPSILVLASVILLFSSGCDLSKKEADAELPAVTSCKAEGGFWRWGKTLPKSTGECMRKTKDAHKVCTDSQECESHFCETVNCNDGDSCGKQTSGECLSHSGSRLGCGHHFEKGKVVADIHCGDSMEMYIDGTP